MKRSTWKLCPAALALLALAAAPAVARAAVFNPDRTTDSADGACDAHCSLREAILAANATAGEDVIVLRPGVYRLSLAGAGEDLAATGDLDIRDDLVLVGDRAANTIIDAGGIDRVLHLREGVSVEIRDITLRNGRLQGQGVVGGGGILNIGSLTLTRSVVTGNTTDGSGGGIFSSGSGAVLTLSQSTVSDNTASGRGGGLAIDGTATLTNVTISGNRSLTDFGGGLYFSSNTRSTVDNATITGNSAAQRGGGVVAESAPFLGTAPDIANSILAGNTASAEPDCSGAVSSLGYNLVGNGTGCISFSPANHDLEGSTGALLDPRLGPLAGNGGPTPTHALLAGSPALDAGNPAAPGSGGAACEATDQRGAPRPGGARCDIGAFEREAANVCVAGGGTLCLQGGRFKVTATWQAGTGSGEAGAVTLTSDTGYFWFFDPANVEVTIKVLDGCALNDRFWVFLSGLTNVRVDVKVTDTLTGQEKTYTNPQGRVFRTQLDTSAFATCGP
ncbi:MAG TPA: CSLREA domain-containing protein [Thermoanaerobaculia bacterium]|nr:CSLREA domain-containing protein [Thermoanaerobaculia bacterium]